MCLQKGYRHINIILVGHSLGAMTAAKYCYRTRWPENVTVVKMISIAGRLRYFRNSFAWFCEKQKEAIDANYHAYLEDPNKVRIVSIRGRKDAIVPEESVHFHTQPYKHTIEGYGHLGVIYATETHRITQ